MCSVSVHVSHILQSEAPRPPVPVTANVIEASALEEMLARGDAVSKASTTTGEASSSEKTVGSEVEDNLSSLDRVSLPDTECDFDISYTYVHVQQGLEQGLCFQLPGDARGQLAQPPTPANTFHSRSPSASFPPTRWYRVAYGGGLEIRDRPFLQSQQTGGLVVANELVAVTEELPGVDGRIYLRLADGRGWIFDDTALMPSDPSVVLCDVASSMEQLRPSTPLVHAPIESSAQTSDEVPVSWYRVAYIGGIILRAGPSLAEPATGDMLRFNDVVAVAEELQGADGRLYLRLCGGRGWGFCDLNLHPNDPSMVRGHFVNTAEPQGQATTAAMALATSPAAAMAPPPPVTTQPSALGTDKQSNPGSKASTKPRREGGAFDAARAAHRRRERRRQMALLANKA